MLNDGLPYDILSHGRVGAVTLYNTTGRHGSAYVLTLIMVYRPMKNEGLCAYG
jgi:hypothetical protein